MTEFNLDQQIDQLRAQVQQLIVQLHQAEGALAAFVALRDGGAVVTLPDQPAAKEE
jgi:lauroyl/myristoyl acyltransferase